MNTPLSPTRKLRKIPLKDKELRFLPKRLLEVKVTLPDPDRVLNLWDSWLPLMSMLKPHTVEIVVEDVEAVAVTEVAVVVPEVDVVETTEPLTLDVDNANPLVES